MSWGMAIVKQDYGRGDLVKLAASAGAVLSWRPCKAAEAAELASGAELWRRRAELKFAQRRNMEVGLDI
ncbi:hypothetical protein Taro_011760 [Colocasia esculenta]|uniref:Uncharacterized protein n=1 Tax=Colocasia esculenta TaxID=4460 RepID=A0A843UAY4_COLES|nr:hypothetical protein [Colocasia esculenta]